MIEINQQQVAAWLRLTLAAGGPIGALILSKTGVTASDYGLYYEAALALLPGLIVTIWSWFRNRHATEVNIVENKIDGVVVTPTTPAGANLVKQATGLSKPVEPSRAQ